MSERFYTPDPITIGEISLQGSEAHHLTRVMRLQTGDAIVLFNGDGREYHAVVLSPGKREARLNVIRIESPKRELAFPLHIAAALPKGDRTDFLIEKLTELGVSEFTPLISARSVVRPDESKTEKLRRAVIEASKQCGRNVLMRIQPPQRFADWCRLDSLPKRKGLAHPESPTPVLGEIGTGIALAVGPEGGFTEEEVALADSAGFERIGLGPRLLRIETAALALAAWIGVGG
jgi:16S rRNA (uracil1498-N3)-methyltransferase